jgi:hypothetical protein
MISESIAAEQEELGWLLTSGALGRSQNLARLLTFICEKHFRGEDQEVKEYSIAVEALGRRSDFNAQTDTIVRVTAHTLRKRLQEIYQGEGAGHGVHVLIPAGQYLPVFVHRPSAPAPALASDISVAAPSDVLDPPATPFAASPARHTAPLRWLFAVVIGAVGAVSWLMVHRTKTAANAFVPAASSVTVTAAAPNTLRLLLGQGRKPYIDHSGNQWMPDTYCTGGTSLTPTPQPIAGTDDPEIYLGGIRGIADCVIPRKPGYYELHFYFAETADVQPVQHSVGISVDYAAKMDVDVVDAAGGRGIALSRVVRGVQPEEKDGAIHVGVYSNRSLLNALEILPTPSAAMLPVRIAAGSTHGVDAFGEHWLSDRYIRGGRIGDEQPQEGLAYAPIYAFNRVGTFHYSIPVVAGEKYRLRLYFRESWFGRNDRTLGGPGKRVFDVSCNGNVLLKHFDMFAEAKKSPLVKTFDNVEATAQGKIDLDFARFVNYPLINAIEVLPQPVR